MIWLAISPDILCHAVIGVDSIKDIEREELRRPNVVEPIVIEKPVGEYTSESLRDPFKPYVLEEKKASTGEGTTEEALPRLEVQGIIWGSTLPQAIINNTVVKAGDTIEEARILEIGKEGVTIFFKNRQYKLGSPGLSPGTDSP